METFITYLNGGSIPENKEEEFRERVKKLFNAGGMMEFQYIRYKKYHIPLLKPVDFDKYDSLCFCYNYFEEDFWQEAGLHRYLCKVNSEKVGGKHFCLVMLGAYIFESLYVDRPRAILLDGQPITNEQKSFIGWMNYLFNENYSMHGWDKWKVAELIMKDHEETHEKYKHIRDNIEEDVEECLMIDLRWIDNEIERDYGYYPMLADCELTTYKVGTDIMKSRLYQYEPYTLTLFSGIQRMKTSVEKLKKESKLSTQEQISILIESIRQYIEVEDLEIVFDKVKQNEILSTFVTALALLDSPMLAIKVISEVYNENFWELYHKLDKCERRMSFVNDDSKKPVNPKVKTQELLNLNPDDMIYFWKKDGDIELSYETKQWFYDLKQEFDRQMTQTIYIENVMNWIKDILVFAELSYRHVMAFYSFYCETEKHKQDKKYIVLWKMFDDMCHDKTMLENGSVIFEDNKPLVYDESGNLVSKRLKDPWEFLDEELKNNSSRLKLRRYLALVANKELRKKVFGF